MPSPVEIIALMRPTFTFVWADEHESVYSARDLRLRCKCAMCVEEMTGRPLLDPASVPEGVCATALKTVGNYGVSVAWSDGHSTGIYNWRDLRAGCPCISCVRIRARGEVPE